MSPGVWLLLVLRLGAERRLVRVAPDLVEPQRDQPGVARAWVVRWHR